MGSDDYQWVAHQSAVQRILQLTGKERALVLGRVRQLAESPHTLESEKGFTLPDEAPFFVVRVGKHILTLQVDHAVRELRLLAIE